MRLALAALALFWLTGAWGAEVRLEELPSEAQATLALIKSGGPFPYAQDGRVCTTVAHGVSLPEAAASTTTAPITTAPSGG